MLLASQSVWELQRYSLIQQHLCPTRWQKSSWPSFEVDLDGKLACRRRSSSLTADAPRPGACRREPVVEPKRSLMDAVLHHYHNMQRKASANDAQSVAGLTAER